MDKKSRYYYREETSQIPRDEFQREITKITYGLRDLLSSHNWKDWPKGIVPVLFVVSPSGQVSFCQIFENAPKDSLLRSKIEGIFYNLNFSPLKSGTPDTIIFNTVFAQTKE